MGLFCGAVLDYRTTEQVLQSHAALWFTPVTGVDPATCAGGWSEALDRAHRVFADRLMGIGAEGETLNSLTLMLGVAAENVAADDLYQACVPLGRLGRHTGAARAARAAPAPHRRTAASAGRLRDRSCWRVDVLAAAARARSQRAVEVPVDVGVGVPAGDLVQSRQRLPRSYGSSAPCRARNKTLRTSTN
ncbi:hypothetical protein ACFQ7N_19400 [Streptomyces niveus]|uniref:hypothetical protein n=1 Tax=Streptomyces niveus TaxID=193462 RepID=UPI0036AB78EC